MRYNKVLWWLKNHNVMQFFQGQKLCIALVTGSCLLLSANLMTSQFSVGFHCWIDGMIWNRLCDYTAECEGSCYHLKEVCKNQSMDVSDERIWDNFSFGCNRNIMKSEWWEGKRCCWISYRNSWCDMPGCKLVWEHIRREPVQVFCLNYNS